MNERNTFNMVTLELFIFHWHLSYKSKIRLLETSAVLHSIYPVEPKAWLYIRRDYARAFCHLLSNDDTLDHFTLELPPSDR